MNFSELMEIRNTSSEAVFSVSVTISEKHLNSHGTVHGGALYSICMDALAEYVEKCGRQGAGMEGSIHYYRPAFTGDELTATVSERKVGKKTGVYLAELKNAQNKPVADCLFTVMFAD